MPKVVFPIANILNANPKSSQLELKRHHAQELYQSLWHPYLDNNTSMVLFHNSSRFS